MALVRRDPGREMEDMLDRYTRTMGQPRAGSQEVIATGDWAPRVDIAETDKAFEIKAEIPEVNKEDVKVTVHNGVLTVQGERKQEKEEKGKKFHRVERYYRGQSGVKRQKLQPKGLRRPERSYSIPCSISPERNWVYSING